MVLNAALDWLSYEHRIRAGGGSCANLISGRATLPNWKCNPSTTCGPAHLTSPASLVPRFSKADCGPQCTFHRPTDTCRPPSSAREVFDSRVQLVVRGMGVDDRSERASVPREPLRQEEVPGGPANGSHSGVPNSLDSVIGKIPVVLRGYLRKQAPVPAYVPNPQWWLWSRGFGDMRRVVQRRVCIDEELFRI